MPFKFEELSSVQKAAIALIAFGTEVSAEVLKSLPDEDLEKITIEIANMRDIPGELEEKVIEECYNIFLAREYISQGGVDYAKKLLEKAVGSRRASDILGRLESSLVTTGFNLLKKIDSKQLASFIQTEHPQTISLILTQLTPQLAAGAMAEFAPELQAEVAMRIATMEKISPEVLKDLESTLDSHFSSNAFGESKQSGGAKSLADMLNLIETSAEKNILQSLEADNPDLAAEIKNMMFIFEDLVLLDDRSIQRLLKEIETKDIAIALKAASDEVKNKIYTNVSERVAVMIKEEIEFMGPMRLSDVEAAQQRIVEAIRRLEEEGQIIISGRGGKEDVVV